MTAPSDVPGRAWVGTSWKMNKTIAESRAYAGALAAAGDRWRHVQPFILPPLTALAAVRETLGSESGVVLGAQNAHWADAGAWTGEVSVPQVADAGAELVEIGHSERRENFGETDRTVNLKVRAVLRHGLIPLICVGEPRAVFEAGESEGHVLAQAEAALTGVTDRSRVLLAYEPFWAIGDSGRPAEALEVAPVCEALATTYPDVRLLYGGSVSASNALDLLGAPGVGGLFIGRAAWQVEGYLKILDLVEASATRSSTSPPTDPTDGFGWLGRKAHAVPRP